MKLINHLLFTILFTAICLTGCKSKNQDDDIIIPVEKLYQDGVDLLNHRQYKKAAEEFGQVFLQHPGDPATPNAELMQSYSLFLATEYEEAVDVLDIFTKLHPMHEDIAYAYYLKALSNYMQISEVALDQSRTALTQESLQTVIDNFPTTKYALDCKLKIDLVNDHLAGKEMEEGRFYLNHKNPMAAINRYEIVIRNYQTTSHVPEALYRLTESYMLLGLKDEAAKYMEVLNLNYSDSKWYRYSRLLHVTK